MSTVAVYVIDLRTAGAQRNAQALSGDLGGLASQIQGLQGVASSGGGLAAMLGAGIGAAVAGGQALVGVLREALGLAADIGKSFFKMASFRETNLIGLKSALGSKEAADKEFMEAVAIADKTPFETPEVVTSLTRLARNFKDSDERKVMFGAIADLATLSGQGKEGLMRGVKAISDVMGKGKLQGEELTGQLAELGLDVGLVYGQLATIYKVKGKDEEEKRQKVVKLISKGAVDSRTGAYAIAAAVKQMTGGVSGSQSLALSDTFEGLWSTITSGWDSLLLRGKVDEWPGMIHLKDLLREISGWLTSPAAERFTGSLRQAVGIAGNLSVALWRIVGAIADGFGAAVGPALAAFGGGLERVTGALIAQGGILELVLDLFAGLGFIAGGLASVFLGIAGAVLYVVHALEELWGWLSKRWDEVAAGITSAFKGMEGLGDSISSGLSSAVAGTRGTGSAISSGLDSAVSGAAGTWDAIGRGLDSALVGMRGANANVPTPAAGGAAGAGGRGAPIQVVINNQVSGVSDPKEAAAQATEGTSRKLIGFFESL